MNRRKFFNILGSAVIGTVIALKIPENIAPIKFLERSKECISFDQLNEMYNDCLRKFGEPSYIVLHESKFNILSEFVGYREDDIEIKNSGDGHWLTFRKAVVQPLRGYSLDEDAVRFRTDRKMFLRRYHFQA